MKVSWGYLGILAVFSANTLAASTISCSAVPYATISLSDSDYSDRGWAPGAVIFHYQIYVRDWPADLLSAEITSCRFDNGAPCYVRLDIGSKLDAYGTAVNLIWNGTTHDWGRVNWSGNFTFRLKEGLDRNTVLTYSLEKLGNNGIVYDTHTSATPYQSGHVNITSEAPFGKVYPGKQDKQLSITSDASGDALLTFTPGSANGQSGTLKNSTGDEIGYSVLNAEWNNGKWTSRLTTGQNYMLQLNDIAKGTTAGKYEGNLTVTLTCE